MKLRKKIITKPDGLNYNYCDCPYMLPNGRGCGALVTMFCRNPNNLPCGFYPEEKKRRAGIEAK